MTPLVLLYGLSLNLTTPQVDVVVFQVEYKQLLTAVINVLPQVAGYKRAADFRDDQIGPIFIGVANRQQTGVFFLVARQGVKVAVLPRRHRPTDEDTLQIIGQHMVILLPLFGNDLLRHGLEAGVVATLVVAEQLLEQITI